MKISKIYFIIPTGLIPVLLVIFYSEITTKYEIKTEIYFEFVKAILPLVFSIIVLLINTALSDRKDKTELLREIRKNKLQKLNSDAEIYNQAFLNNQKIYHLKMRYLRQALSAADDFFKIGKLPEIYADWKKTLHINLDGSNDKNIRNSLREELITLINNCCKDASNLNKFELLSNSKIYTSTLRHLTDEYQVFVSQFASNHESKGINRNIIHISLEVLATGGSSEHALEQFNSEVYTLKTILSAETTSKVFYESTYGAAIQLLFLIECLLTDLFFLQKGFTLFASSYNKYHKKEMKEFPDANSVFSIIDIVIPADVTVYFNEDAAFKKTGMI